ncbi:TorF family putative porin [Niveispirillum sp. KHB5.9]|uniref:TorF family putative porin n=1 Tax=Niveispirillum sp. KHB5.9 TaxID=3400269 RepID=UPI003A8AC8AE
MVRFLMASLALVLWAAPALADVEGAVGITSDYVDRGLSNSHGHAALQGGVTWTHESGLFATLDGSMVDFGDGTDAELNTIAGYEWAGDGWALVAAAGHTHYVGAPARAGLDLWEFALAGALDLDTHQWEAELIYSPDDGGAGVALYKRIGVTIPFAGRFALSPHLGHQGYRHHDRAGPGYWDWGLELSYDLAPATIGIAYTDTDLGREPGCLCGGRLAAFITVAFP